MIDVGLAWSRLHEWFAEWAPETLASFRPGATGSALRAAEAHLGVTLPADYRKWLTLHDGLEPRGLALPDLPLPLAGVLRVHDSLGVDEVPDDDVDADAGVRPVPRSAKWIPITDNPAGDHICLDLDPAPGGRSGQVICYWSGTLERTHEAASFTDWLVAQRAAMDAGELLATEWAGFYYAVVSRRSALHNTQLDIRGPWARKLPPRDPRNAPPGALACGRLIRKLVDNKRLVLRRDANVIALMTVLTRHFAHGDGLFEALSTNRHVAELRLTREELAQLRG